MTRPQTYSSKPKKKLVDVYRAVFSLRREVFTNRPIPNDAGKTSPEDEQWFQKQCSAICATLMFLVCVLDPALPEENGKYCVYSMAWCVSVCTHGIVCKKLRILT